MTKDYPRFKRATIRAIETSLDRGQNIGHLKGLIKRNLECKTNEDIIALSKDEDFISYLKLNNLH